MMTLPVSSYEELLARVRNLTSETIQLRREITSSLCDQTALTFGSDNCPVIKICSIQPQRPSLCQERNQSSIGGLTVAGEKHLRPGSVSEKKGDEFDDEFKEIDEKLTSPDTSIRIHGNGWAADNFGLRHSGPSSLCFGETSNNFPYQDLTSSVTCTSYEPQPLNNFSCASKRAYSHQQLGAKVEMVYGLLSMLDTDNREDMSKTFLAMSSSPESCQAMRQSGCLPLLIQLIHSPELNAEVRNRAAAALHNIVHAQTDDKRRRREVRVLKLLQQVREYCDELKNVGVSKSLSKADSEKHPINAIGTLMKFSFDAEHRQAICTLGGLHAITDLIQVDHEVHGSASEDSLCITLRRYAGMFLTNLTFGDGKNKALLCSFNKFMLALVDQLKSPSEELRQVTASVLRNLSWRADEESMKVLRNVSAVTALTVSAMEGKKESTLKSILSALWNLSAHCSQNKVDISSVPGALAFLVKMLSYQSSSNTLAIVENAGGILRNISSHIAIREDYRQILRDNNCFEVLLEQLKSPSLTIVSNACGTLWNLSARCPEDQKKLWDMGATTMLRSLIQSKHKMISMGSSAALKNLLAANPNKNLVAHLDSTAKSLGLQNLPALFVRKKKALEQELNITLAETCENIEGMGSPNHAYTAQNKVNEKTLKGPKRSDSRDSLRSTQSDSVYERINQIVLKNQEKLFENNNVTLHDSLSEKVIPQKIEEQKLIRRYKTSMIPLPTVKKTDQDRTSEKTKEEIFITKVEHCCKEDSKEKRKKGISLVKMRSLDKFTSGVDFSKIHEEIDDSTEESLSKESSLGATLQSPVGDILLDKEKEIGESLKRDKLDEDVNEENTNCEIMQEVKSKSVTENMNSCESKNHFNNQVITSAEEITEEKHRCDATESRESYPFDRFQACHMRDDANLKVRNIVTDSESVSSASQELRPEERKCSDRISPSARYLENDLGGVRSSVSSTGLLEVTPSLLTDLVEFEIPENKEGFINSFTAGNKESKINLKEIKLNTIEMVDPIEENEDATPILNVQNELTKCTGSKKSNDSVLPKFKVGSPITDSKILHHEASKICREIKKHQDGDMGCSLTSEVSLISCSSFLDTTECSLFESCCDGIDFDESESQFLVKSLIRTKNFNLRQTTGESVSLPSLGSHKNDQIETLDLDNSILSITSFTSEIADAELKGAGFDTHTKTCKNDDCQEQTIEDSSFPDGDETLNADTLQNNGELYDDDSSLHCEENLPLDSETFEDLKSQDPIKKKLTPKEKRKTFCERYRTYTIKDVKLVEPPMTTDEVDEERENVQNIQTAVNINSELYGRYYNNNFDANEEKRSEFGSLSSTIYRENKIESFQFSKSFEKIETSFPVSMSDSRSLNDLLSIGPDERKELVVNAKLVAFSLKTAVHDFDGDLVSDSDGDELQNSLTIDTATYSKNNRPIHSTEELEKFNHSTDLLDKKGAKVLKPCEALESPKVVRGRRKPLYTSAPKNLRAVDPSPPKYSCKSITNPKLCKPALRREGTFTKQEESPQKKTDGKSIKAIPVLSRNSEFKSSIPKSGVRNASAPGLAISGTSKGRARPSPTHALKNSDRRTEFDSIQKRFVSAGNGNKTPKQSFATKRHTTGNSSQNMRSSLSNQNSKTGCSPGLRSRNVALQNLKSQSDAGLNVITINDKVAAGNQKTPKKEITSKIAGLWRKVEETKQKNKNFKDRRLWIGPEKNENIPDDVLVIEQEEIVEIPRQKMLHSRTCQNLSDEIFVGESKDLRSESSNEMKPGFERRRIVSAVVQPYNYNPPTSTQVTLTNLKQVDVFHKGSLKVTTV